MRLDHDDAVHVIASGAGAPRDPAWFRNLDADPRVRVRDGGEVWDARAVVLEGAERDEVYAAAVDELSGSADHAASTDRKIPVVRLEPLVDDPGV